MVQKQIQHLKKGDAQPPVQKGVLRLYGMRFCPYDQRVHLVLDTKKIPYDTVYINLNDKPEWMLTKSDGAKVPTVEFDDGKVLVESLIIADYLDEAYPESPLYPKDPRAKAEQRILLEKFGGVKDTFYKMIFYENERSAENFEKLVNALQIYENGLGKAETPFFGGAKPGMLDLMIWPWLERIPLLATLGGDSFTLPSKRLPNLTNWTAAMLSQEPVRNSYLKPEIHAKFMASRKMNNPIYDFDYTVSN